MFSDKTKSYFLATSKKAFLKNFNKKEFVQQFNFGEVLFVLDEFNNLYALENKCPHQGLKMQGCIINKGKVICPWHQYKFDLKNGRGHGLYLPTFELEENSKGFFLKRTYFSWFGE